MNLGGWQKVSLVDYPGKICTILFAQGCNFRCPYCHNPELVLPSLFKTALRTGPIFAYLEKRKGIIDGVTVTGGEPTIQADLTAFIDRIKELGYLVKLDTNGSRPRVLKELIGRGVLDYIAMDIKGPLERYDDITRTPVVLEDIRESVQVIMGSGIPCEFRTTVVESLLAEKDFEQIGRLIRHAPLYTLQHFIPSKALDPGYLQEAPTSEEYLSRVKALLENDIQLVEVR